MLRRSQVLDIVHNLTNRGALSDMLRIKNSQKGFTIVELLIVIVVIGILAALVINTFTGVQRRARDSERQTDTKAVAAQLERYYADNDGYPVRAAQLNTDSWLTSNFQGMPVGAARAPGQTANSFGITTDTVAAQSAPTTNQYGYISLNADDTTPCTVAPCAKFKVYYRSENNNTVTTISSSN